MTPMPPGTEWTVLHIPRTVDGDTVRMIRWRLVDIDGRRYIMQDADPTGVPVRLVWVDTPERGQPGYKQARQDLDSWIAARTHHLRVIVYDGGAGFDRLLGDLLDDDGQSASQYLMIEKGWLPYVRGH